MAVDPTYHRRGIGRALIAQAEDWSRAANIEYLQVKTLGASHPSVEYAQTREFYLACGFRPLEEFDNLWPGNPCLILIKRL
jgi:GNAT superfamily N-acetyltransferase